MQLSLSAAVHELEYLFELSMKKSIILFSTLGLFTFLGGCFNDWSNCYSGNGVEGEAYRELENFTSIQSNSSIDVELIWDSVPGVTISGDENLLTLVETRVVGNSLLIDYHDRADCIKANQRMVVTVHYTDIEEITVDGSGDIYGRDTLFSKDLHLSVEGSGQMELEAVVDFLLIDIDGSGDVRVDGSGDEGHVNINGSADVDISGLELETLLVEVDGSGDVKATVSERLRVWMNGSGDVRYRGGAQLIMEENDGSGDVRKF